MGDNQAEILTKLLLKEQKLLFADIYNTADNIKQLLREVNKISTDLLYAMSWEACDIKVNGILGDVQLIEGISAELCARIAEFTEKNSIYAYQTAGQTPIETMATREADAG